jgi:adenine-specific DNA-methyltransferase
MPSALADLIGRARADLLVVSYNDESWITPEEMTSALREAGHECVQVLAFDSRRYVGAQIGIHGPTGEKVGEVRRLRNVEYLFLAGDRDRVDAASSATGRMPAAGGRGSRVEYTLPAVRDSQ